MGTSPMGMEVGMTVGKDLRTEWAQHALSSTRSASAMAPSPMMRKLETAAQEFEGILMASLWQAWNKSDRMGTRHDPIGNSMTGMGIEMASIAMAKNGGIGIARMIVNSLTKEVAGQHGN